MKVLKLAAASLMLALAGTAAGAFEEQKAGGVSPEAGAPAAAAAPEGAMGLEAGKAPAGEAGTEVNIPGLGKLGVLPKMDFGLELLYGVGETKAQPQPETATEPEDLTIRGTVKHKF